MFYGAKKTSLGRFRKLYMPKDILILSTKISVILWTGESPGKGRKIAGGVLERRQLFLLQCFTLKRYTKTQRNWRIAQSTK